MRWLRRGFRVRTLLTLVALVAVFLGGSRMAMRAYRTKMYRQEAQKSADSRDRYREMARVFRSRGNDFAAAKQDRYAEYCEGWRLVFENASSSGEMVYGWSGPPPVP